MRYLRLYDGPDGESHFEEVALAFQPVEYGPGWPRVDISTAHAASAVVFARLAPGWHGEAQPTPRRQVLVTLSGELEIVASDGQVRRLSPGMVCLQEDTDGKGHSTRNVGAAPWLGFVARLE